MIHHGRFSVLGVGIDAVDYETAVTQIIDAAQANTPYAVSALAVHGVMTGVQDPEHLYRLNHLDLVVPDGQPVRWALRWLHGVRLPDRVYGPTLTLKVCEAAATKGLPLYLYGSTKDVLDLFSKNLQNRFAGLQISGAEPSRFRQLTEEEMRETSERIQDSGARIVLVGLGCPRQEVWAYEYRELLQMPLLAVGAAFDFHAKTLPQAPRWMQNAGLEWFFRLMQEPGRLWKRYLFLNPVYVFEVIRQRLSFGKETFQEEKLPVEVKKYG